MNSEIERTHLEIVKRRRDEIGKGQVKPIDGEYVSKMVRRMTKVSLQIKANKLNK
jgi:hypothetical protein